MHSLLIVLCYYDYDGDCGELSAEIESRLWRYHLHPTSTRDWGGLRLESKT